MFKLTKSLFEANVMKQNRVVNVAPVGPLRVPTTVAPMAPATQVAAPVVASKVPVVAPVATAKPVVAPVVASRPVATPMGAQLRQNLRKPAVAAPVVGTRIISPPGVPIVPPKQIQPGKTVQPVGNLVKPIQKEVGVEKKPGAAELKKILSNKETTQ